MASIYNDFFSCLTVVLKVLYCSHLDESIQILQSNCWPLVIVIYTVYSPKVQVSDIEWIISPSQKPEKIKKQNITIIFLLRIRKLFS